tara:strand:+ start:419 stop:709 length:291 start_codon:yes stop_codon:yes gene_type:complete
MNRVSDFSFLNDVSKANFSSSNEYSKTDDKTQCNPFSANNNMGNYFQQCSKDAQAALWGSNKPSPDKCELNPKTGIPCHNIWNNQTRRKGVVYYQR